jgi:hypothetical protein
MMVLWLVKEPLVSEAIDNGGQICSLMLSYAGVGERTISDKKQTARVVLYIVSNLM